MSMKIAPYKIITAAFILFISTNFSSCKKFLAEEPKLLTTEENFYKTSDDAVAAVNAIYAYLNSTNFTDINGNSTAGIYHSTFWTVIGLASDEMNSQEIFHPDRDQIANFNFSPIAGSFSEIWSVHYKVITLANIAIARIPLIQMDETLRTRLINEAKFLRGLMYFNMVRMFGSIPLMINENEPIKPLQASLDDIYNQIIQDLSDAETLPQNYPPGQGRGRATSGAAKALLAKVYLTRGDYQSCADKCLEVINSNEYALWDDFADVFKLSSRGGKEAVFSVGFGDADGEIVFWEVAQFLVRLLPSELSVEGVQNAQGWDVPTQNLYDIYDPLDRRREVTFITEVHNPDGSITSIKPYIQKYWDRAAEPQGNQSQNDFPVIRYPDVLLMYAEANNELGNSAAAHQYINMVRKRARFDGTNYRNAVPDYVGLSQQALRDAIIKERRMEFVAEGQRWFDLVRTHTLEQLVPLAKNGITPQAKNYLFPIPQRELDLNPNLVQNEGY